MKFSLVSLLGLFLLASVAFAFLAGPVKKSEAKQDVWTKANEAELRRLGPPVQPWELGRHGSVTIIEENRYKGE